jgi:hypothetical protein
MQHHAHRGSLRLLYAGRNGLHSQADQRQPVRPDDVSHEGSLTGTYGLSVPLRRALTPQSPAPNASNATAGRIDESYDTNPQQTRTYSSPSGHGHTERLTDRSSYPNISNEPPEEHTGAQIVSAAVGQNIEPNDLPFYIGISSTNRPRCPELTSQYRRSLELQRSA